MAFEIAEMLAFAGILVYASLVDIRERRIPNGCIIAALAVRIAYMALAFAFGWLNAQAIGYFAFSACAIGLALIVFTIVADKAFGRESMGGGDLKLYFVAGLYFGWQQGLAVVALSCVFGIVIGLIDELKTRRAPIGERKGALGPSGEEPGFLTRTLPFGPPIAAACIITMLVGGLISH